jgi:hypothetical protein
MTVYLFLLIFLAFHCIILCGFIRKWRFLSHSKCSHKNFNKDSDLYNSDYDSELEGYSTDWIDVSYNDKQYVPNFGLESKIYHLGNLRPFSTLDYYHIFDLFPGLQNATTEGLWPEDRKLSVDEQQMIKEVSNIDQTFSTEYPLNITLFHHIRQLLANPTWSNTHFLNIEDLLLSANCQLSNYFEFIPSTDNQTNLISDNHVNPIKMKIHSLSLFSDLLNLLFRTNVQQSSLNDDSDSTIQSKMLRYLSQSNSTTPVAAVSITNLKPIATLTILDDYLEDSDLSSFVISDILLSLVGLITHQVITSAASLSIGRNNNWQIEVLYPNPLQLKSKLFSLSMIDIYMILIIFLFFFLFSFLSFLVSQWILSLDQRCIW